MTTRCSATITHDQYEQYGTGAVVAWSDTAWHPELSPLGPSDSLEDGDFGEDQVELEDQHEESELDQDEDDFLDSDEDDLSFLDTDEDDFLDSDELVNESEETDEDCDNSVISDDLLPVDDEGEADYSPTRGLACA